MQTARLMEPRPRNIVSKAIEAFRAWQLERRLNKEEILELYLTMAPYGGNLEGVRAASWAYFGREPDNLSPDQIAMLIALPQSPEARRPDLRPKAAIVARERVLMRLADEGVFAKDLAAESAEYPAPTRGDFPQLAWHASEEALRRAAEEEARQRLKFQQHMQTWGHACGTHHRLQRAVSEAQGKIGGRGGGRRGSCVLSNKCSTGATTAGRTGGHPASAQLAHWHN